MTKNPAADPAARLARAESLIRRAARPLTTTPWMRLLGASWQSLRAA